MNISLSLGLDIGSTRSSGGTPTPTPTPLRPVSNNTVMPTAVITTGQVEQSTIHTVRASGGITSLAVAMPGYYIDNSLTAPYRYIEQRPLAAAYTVQAMSVEYPVGSGNWYPIRRGGATSWTVSPWDGVGTGNVWSDETALGITIPDGADYRLFYYATGTAMPGFNPGSTRALFTDEGCNRNATANATPKNVTDSDSNRRWRACVTVGHFSRVAGDAVAIIGDSQQQFSSSSYALNTGSFADHNRGDIASTIGGTYAYLNLAIGADQWETRLWNFASFLELANTCTIIIDQLGINSFNNKANTADGALAWKRRALPFFNGKKVIAATTSPRTTGAWTLADGSDQTLATYSASLKSTYIPGLTFGGLLPSPLDRYTPLENAGAANKWKADGTAQRWTVDGLHLSDTAAHTDMKALAQAAWQAQLAALSPVTATQPDANFVVSGATFGGGYATAGTFTRNDIIPGQGLGTVVMRVKSGAIGAAAAIMPSPSVNAWIRQLRIDVAGTVTLTSASSAVLTSTATVLDNIEHEIAVTYSNVGNVMQLFIDGVSQGTTTLNAASSIAPVMQIACQQGVNIREVTVWNTRIFTADYTPALFTGTEAGLVARWPLATNGTAILGPVLP